LRGKQSSAFWGFIRILDEMKKRRPPIVLIENVTGFLTSHGGNDFKEALLALNELGYGVDAFIVDAASFKPQSRQRLFVVGVMEDKPERGEQPPRLGDHPLRPKALAQFISSHPEINWNIRNLPAPPEAAIKLGEILEDLPDDAPEWWSAERAAYLLNQMSPRHRAVD
jgi:DNA (cytosine-5)-methyltransferase 1